MVLNIVRHVKTPQAKAPNDPKRDKAVKRSQGWGQTRSTSNGILEAMRLHDSLPVGYDPLFVTSPLRRAVTTAVLAGGFGYIAPFFNENDCNPYEPWFDLYFYDTHEPLDLDLLLSSVVFNSPRSFRHEDLELIMTNGEPYGHIVRRSDFTDVPMYLLRRKGIKDPAKGIYITGSIMERHYGDYQTTPKDLVPKSAEVPCVMDMDSWAGVIDPDDPIQANEIINFVSQFKLTEIEPPIYRLHPGSPQSLHAYRYVTGRELRRIPADSPCSIVLPETIAAVAARVAPEMAYLQALTDSIGRDVVIISHNNPMRITHGLTHGINPEDYRSIGSFPTCISQEIGLPIRKDHLASFAQSVNAAADDPESLRELLTPPLNHAKYHHIQGNGYDIGNDDSYERQIEKAMELFNHGSDLSPYQVVRNMPLGYATLHLSGPGIVHSDLCFSLDQRVKSMLDLPDDADEERSYRVCQHCSVLLPAYEILQAQKKADPAQAIKDVRRRLSADYGFDTGDFDRIHRYIESRL